jgi:hypothetical protein
MPVDPEWWLDDGARKSLTPQQRKEIVAATNEYNEAEADAKATAATKVADALDPDTTPTT